MKVIGTDGKEYMIKPEADLEGADLNRANLSNAELSGAYLIRADLTDVCLNDANLSGAVWNDDTVFPEGFEIPEKSKT